MSTAAPADAAAALRGFWTACRRLDAEVIVVRAVEPDRILLDVSSELGWRLLEVPAGCTSAHMRSEGMAAARGDIVAFRTDADAGDGLWLDTFSPVLGYAASADAELPVAVIDERKVAAVGRRGGALDDEAATYRARTSLGTAESLRTRES